jgi:tetratricopeptide (TPR) repeat protein
MSTEWFLLPAIIIAVLAGFSAVAGIVVVLGVSANVLLGSALGEQRSRIQQRGGVRGLAGVAGWFLGMILIAAGGLSIFGTILFSVPQYFAGHDFAQHSRSVSAANAAVSLLVLLVGCSTMWTLRKSNFEFSWPIISSSDSAIRVRAKILRWCNQWFLAGFISWFVLDLLPLLVSLPQWLGPFREAEAWRGFSVGIGAVLGAVWASIDLFRQRGSSKESERRESFTPTYDRRALDIVFTVIEAVVEVVPWLVGAAITAAVLAFFFVNREPGFAAVAGGATLAMALAAAAIFLYRGVAQPTLLDVARTALAPFAYLAVAAVSSLVLLLGVRVCTRAFGLDGQDWLGRNSDLTMGLAMGTMVVATGVTYFLRRSITQATIIVAATFLVAGIVGFFVGLPYDHTVEHSAVALLSSDAPKSKQANFRMNLFGQREPCAVKSGKVSDVKHCELFGIRLGMTVDEVKKVIDESGYFSEEARLTKPCGNPDPRCVGFIYIGDSDVLNIAAEFSASRDHASRLVASEVTMWLGSGTNPYFEPANMRETFVRLFGPPDWTYQDHYKWGDVDETGGVLISAYPYEKQFVVILKDNPVPVDAPLSRKSDWCSYGTRTPAIRIMACTAVIQSGELSDEKRAKAYRNRGEAYYLDSDYDRSIVDITEAIRIDPNYADAYNRRGDLYSMKGDYDRATADYNEAIRINPKFSDAYVGRAQTYRKKSDFDHAFEDLGEAIHIDPNSDYAYEVRGLTNFYAGKYDAAVADFEHLADLDLDDVLLRYIARVHSGDQGAVANLETDATKLKQSSWPFPAVELFLGRRTPEETLSAAPSLPGFRCDAEFYVGEWYLLHADRAAATQHLKASAEMCPKAEDARAELKHLEQ